MASRWCVFNALLFALAILKKDVKGQDPNEGQGTITLYANKYYSGYLSDDDHTWEEAQAYCEGDGSELATITSSNWNDWVRSSRLDWSKDSFIGLNDITTEGTYEWIDGVTSTSYTNWDTSEPEGSDDKDCVVMKANQAWSDIDCDSDKNKQWVCNAINPCDFTLMKNAESDACTFDSPLDIYWTETLETLTEWDAITVAGTIASAALGFATLGAASAGLRGGLALFGVFLGIAGKLDSETTTIGATEQDYEMQAALNYKFEQIADCMDESITSAINEYKSSDLYSKLSYIERDFKELAYYNDIDNRIKKLSGIIDNLRQYIGEEYYYINSRTYDELTDEYYAYLVSLGPFEAFAPTYLMYTSLYLDMLYYEILEAYNNLYGINYNIDPADPSNPYLYSTGSDASSSTTTDTSTQETLDKYCDEYNALIELMNQDTLELIEFIDKAEDVIFDQYWGVIDIDDATWYVQPIQSEERSGDPYYQTTIVTSRDDHDIEAEANWWYDNDNYCVTREDFSDILKAESTGCIPKPIRDFNDNGINRDIGFRMYQGGIGKTQSKYYGYCWSNMIESCDAASYGTRATSSTCANTTINEIHRIQSEFEEGRDIERASFQDQYKTIVPAFRTRIGYFPRCLKANDLNENILNNYNSYYLNRGDIGDTCSNNYECEGNNTFCNFNNCNDCNTGICEEYSVNFTISEGNSVEYEITVTKYDVLTLQPDKPTWLVSGITAYFFCRDIFGTSMSSDLLVSPSPIDSDSFSNDDELFRCEGRPYFNIIEESKTWYDAELYCRQNYNTNLITIRHEKDNNFMWKILNTLDQTKGMWIGLNSINRDNSWEWASKDYHNQYYSNTLENNYENLDNDCVSMRQNGTWIQTDCTETTKWFICDANDHKVMHDFYY